MAYDVFYYRNRRMTRQLPDLDKIGDMLDRYPAPTGNEVAHAIHSSDAGLNRYGYDGGWHVEPPAEAAVAAHALPWWR